MEKLQSEKRCKVGQQSVLLKIIVESMDVLDSLD